MKQTMQIYVKTKGHYGNTVEVARLLYGPYHKDVILEQTTKPLHFQNFRIVGLAIRYLLANGFQQYPIVIRTPYRNVIRSLNQLPKWSENAWPISKYNSEQLYQMTDNQHHIPLDKIPSNYVPVLAILKWIYAKTSEFKLGLAYTFYSSKSNDRDVKQLTNLAKQTVQKMPPAPSYRRKKQAKAKNKEQLRMLKAELPAFKEFKMKQAIMKKQGKAMLNIPIDLNLKQKLDQKLNANHQQEIPFFIKIIMNYLKPKNKKQTKNKNKGNGTNNGQKKS